MKASTSADQLFKRVLGQTALLTGLIASLGSLAGYFVEGQNGVVSALALLFIPAELVLALSIASGIPVLVYTVWPVIKRRRKRAKSK